MTISLIPRNELTLDLLADVLAKMYRHSLNNGHHMSDMTSEPELVASYDVHGRRSLGGEMSRPDLAQAETVQVMSNKHNPAVSG